MTDVAKVSETPTSTVPLGVTYDPSGSRFCVFAEAEEARVRLLHPGTRHLVERELKPVGGERGVFAAIVEGDYRGWSYSYTIVRGGRVIGEIVDPRATLVRSGRGYVCADRSTVSPRPAMNVRDAVIYELHLRDFTRDPACGVKESWRGRYLGLAQRGAKLDGTELSTGLDHIVELGVNVVQLMPVQSFALPYNPEYEWGYMPLHYFAPHDGYASSVEMEAPVREFKQMVSALHEAGLRVTLDVVFNHTAEKWPDRLRSLMALAPREYFRWKDDGTPWDGSLCGNEFRSESVHGRRLIVECCKKWVTEFGVDGFRFDLMGLIDKDTMQALATELRAIDPAILIYGEPWAAGPTPIAITAKGTQKGRGWGVFNDEMRDGLRGEVFNTKDLGFLNAGEDIAAVKSGLRGAIDRFTDSPLESINYVECHDNHTLVDRLKLVTPPGPPVTEEDHVRMNLLGALILMTSQGIPFIHSGQEFGRSKEGHPNTFDLGDQINNIKWRDKEIRYRLFSFYRSVIAVRRAHPMFRLTTGEQVRQAIRFMDEHLKIVLPPGTIGAVVDDVTGEDTWSRAVLVFNGSRNGVRMPLPEGEWMLMLRDGSMLPEPQPTREFVNLDAHWGALLFQRR